MTDSRMTHAEAELLLPWYANCTLDSRERTAVGDHLEQCEECRQALALLTRMKMAVTDSGTVPLVPDPQPDKLLELLDQRSKDSGTRRPTMRWPLAAGIALVALSVALMYSLPSSDPVQPAYRTATSADSGDLISYVVELRFVDSVTTEQHQDVLDELGATPISSAESGTVRVIIPIATSSMSEAETWRSELANRSEIASVRIVAVQLPVLEDE